MILDIDKSKVISDRAIDSPVLGVIPPTSLSGGVKTLILIDHITDKIFNASNCGDNCAEWLLKIADKKDVTNKEISQILDNPSDFIDSKEYFSWEQFFTKLLIQKTKSTFLKYSKRKLNKNYLEDSIKSKIINSKAFIAIKSLFEK